MVAFRLCLFVAVSAIIGHWPATAGAQFEEPVQRVLLLKNGQTLTGDVVRKGDRFCVSLPHGQIVLEADEVQHVCTSIVEGYLRKRAAIRFGDVEDRLALARWCLSQKLLEEAKTELAEARSLSPNSKAIAAVERQLEIASQPSAKFPASNRERKVAAAPKFDDLVRRMPHGSIEAFTKSIQPLLINGCAASSCHGGKTQNDFRLMRFPRGRAAPRRMTLRNLHAVLGFVDAEHPGSSRILQAACEPHGPKSLIVVDRTSPAFQRLTAWVLQVTNVPKKAVPPQSLPNTQPTLSQAISVKPAASGDRSATDNNPPSPPAFVPKLGNEAFQPRDPFDPREFNRRFHGEGP